MLRFNAIRVNSLGARCISGSRKFLSESSTPIKSFLFSVSHFPGIFAVNRGRNGYLFPGVDVLNIWMGSLMSLSSRIDALGT